MDEVKADRLWTRRVRMEDKRQGGKTTGTQETLVRLEEGLSTAMYSTTNDFFYKDANPRLLKKSQPDLVHMLETELEKTKEQRKKAEAEVKRLKDLLESLD